jgi:hypothetical protein
MDDDTYRAVYECEGDAGPIVREFGFAADREVAGARWSYRRDIGRTRLVVMDSRAGRVLNPDARYMVDDQEWACIEEWAHGSFDHLVLGTSLPVFLGRGMHHLEAWNEAVCEGAWGAVAARLGERMRQALDLEHWAAFGNSLRALEDLLERVASGHHGAAPGSVVLLSGDVHHAYLARAEFASDADRNGDGRSPVYQAVCSPLRNPLDGHERRADRRAPGARCGRRARAGHVEDRRGALVRQPGRHARAGRAPRMAGARQGRRPRRRHPATRASDAPAALVAARWVSSPDGREDGRRQRRRCRPGSAGAGAPPTHP